jgi:hypothetical protein
MRLKIAALISGLVLLQIYCSRPSNKVAVLRQFPLDDLQGLIAQSDVQIDRQVSSDGKGSLRIDAAAPITVPLFEVHDLKVDNARLIYHARLRAEKVFGQAYLEMLCHFPGKGEFFSRGQATLLSGTTDWTTQETPFFLQKGEVPDYVKLNLVINGRGTAWIDDIRLLKGPL